jgi:lipoprotein-anchoring transpeptidase ErfK/SrfK
MQTTNTARAPLRHGRPRLAVMGLVGVLAILFGMTAWRTAVHLDERQAAQVLTARWDREQRDGVAAGRLAPLRTELGRLDAEEAGWWWHPWRGSHTDAALAGLEARTAQVWDGATSASRSRAEASLAASSAFAAAHASDLTPGFAQQLATWRTAVASAATPAAYDSLAASIAARTAAARSQVAAQHALGGAPAAGSRALLARARVLASRAQADNLDPGPVPALSDQLSAAVSGRGDPGAVSAQLSGALPGLQGLLGLNDQVAAELRTLTAPVQQAVAEGTPGAPAESSTERSLTAAFAAARTVPQLQAVQQQAQALGPEVAADLAAHRCGHAVPAGKVVTLDLTAQEMVFYENGCAVRATPATSGRPELRTPTGHFAIFAKYSPFVFHSPWPPGSPFWYPTSPVGFAMEFAQGGYFIHDAPWEPDSQMGPGSEDGMGASHGCVHIPLAVMSWLFSWAPSGTPVIVTR